MKNSSIPQTSSAPALRVAGTSSAIEDRSQSLEFNPPRPVGLAASFSVA